MPESIIQKKSYSFALRILKLHHYLNNESHEYVISKQILRSGTSIGANVEEALGGSSKKDFLNKMTISYKEARETNYWLRLLRDGGYLEPKLAESLLTESEEILKIIGKIRVTTKSTLHS